MPDKEQTLGEKRVRMNFNPSANKDVEAFKRMAADFIDLCDSHFRGGDKEAARLWVLAMTHAEDAAMWAVKAITS